MSLYCARIGFVSRRDVIKTPQQSEVNICSVNLAICWIMSNVDAQQPHHGNHAITRRKASTPSIPPAHNITLKIATNWKISWRQEETEEVRVTCRDADARDLHRNEPSHELKLNPAHHGLVEFAYGNES